MIRDFHGPCVEFMRKLNMYRETYRAIVNERFPKEKRQVTTRLVRSCDRISKLNKFSEKAVLSLPILEKLNFYYRK